MTAPRHDLVEQFATIFKGREDAWGKVGGQCVKEPVALKEYARHLHGYESLGIYPLLPDGTVWFAAIDIDEDDPLLAAGCRDTLEEWGVSAYIETSKSKGYHVWVFFSEPVQAKKARALLLATWSAVAPERPAPEIFPKQDAATRVKFGNYINLPYFPPHAEKKRRVMVDGPRTVPVEEFLTNVRRMSAVELDAVIEEQGVTTTTETPRRKSTGSNVVPLGRGSLLPCAKVFLEGGAAEGGRDISLFTLAKHLRRAGYPQEVAVALAQQANSRCRPPVSDGTVEQKVDSAYGGAGGQGYVSLGCDDPVWSAGFCPGKESCEVWQRKAAGEEQAAAAETAEGFSIKPLEAPYPYVLQPTGLYARKVIQGSEELQPVTSAPIWIGATGEDIRSGRMFLDLRYRHRGREQGQWVNRAVAMNARKLVDMAEFGLPVTSANATQVVRYLDAFEAYNAGDLARQDLSSSNGWIDEATFLAGKAVGERKIQLHPEGPGDALIVSGFRSAGRLEDWLAMAKRARKASALARFGLAVGFAGPLLKLLKVRSFIVHLCHESGGGKSAVIKLAVSAWGDPERLMASLNSTKVGVERLAALFSDLVLGLDELQLQDSLEFRRTLAYLLAQGTGKTRGARGGGLQTMATWRLVALTSGEVPMTTSKDFSGQQGRVLDLYGEPVPDKPLAQEMHRFVQDCHGHAGPAFVNRLLFESAARLRATYAEMREEIAKRAGREVRPAHLDGITTVCLADLLVSRWFAGANEAEARLEAIDLGLDVIEYLPPEAEQASYAERALEWTLGWVEQHREAFEAHGREKYGWWVTQTWSAKPTELVLIPTAWEPALVAAGFDPGRVLRDWGEQGWILKDGRNYRVKRGEGPGRKIVLICQDEWFN